MRTVTRSKNNKNGLKKEIVVSDRKTGMTSIAYAAGIESGNISQNSADANSTLTGVSDEERRQLIAEAAYYHAERRSFEPGHELDDWLTAESEIEMKLSSFGTETMRKNS
jgi:hypothetical protein